MTSKTNKPVQLHVHIHQPTKQRLKEYALSKGQSQGAIVEAALRDYFDDASDQTLLLKEMTRLKRSTHRMEEHLDILDVAFTSVVRMWMMTQTPLTEEQLEDARHMADISMKDFITFVDTSLASHSKRRMFRTSLSQEALFSQEDIGAVLDE